MTVSASQPRAVRSERRIIERPRLIKLLDEADARIILLVAAAGYGKTTLARQWSGTLRAVTWMTLTARHQDVAWLATDIARSIDRIEGKASRAIAEEVNARSNPQRAARELGIRLAAELAAAGTQWLILDDYHEIKPSRDAEDLISTLEEQSTLRILIASRARPSWVTARRLLYGEVAEIGRDELAMTDDESSMILGHTKAVDRIARQAAGWPALVSLAAAVRSEVIPDYELPEGLHRYLAEELFQRTPEELQKRLLTLALLGDLSPRALKAQFGDGAEEVVEDATALGFTSSSNDQQFELHPLLREFLLKKLLNEPNSEARVRQAIAANLEAESWDRALELILRFKMFDCIDDALCLAFKPLSRSGRLETLATFAHAITKAPAFPPAAVDVTLAEIALRDGNLELAREFARRAEPNLGTQHPLRSRAAAILGHVSFLLADFERAETAFVIARDTARDERDENEALHGVALANVFGERPGAREALAAVAARRDRTPVDFLRFVTADVALRRLGGEGVGLNSSLHVDAVKQTLPQADDPRARTSATYTIACALAQRGDYADAREWLAICLEDAARFDLEFTMPYANWTSGQIALGQRRFAEAERSLQAVEDAAAKTRDRHHELNARTLRARLLLQNGDTAGASECLRLEPDIPLIPSWLGEYLATRAVAMACEGRAADALETADRAERITIAVEVHVLAQVARAIAISDGSGPETRRLVELASRSGVWDPVVCGVRSSPTLAEALANDADTRPAIADLYRRTQDTTLARRAGLRTRATAKPSQVLSPREFEVLGLIALGYRNHDISRALFIADSTTKVHIRHILEKLGVRTRSEAVARFQMFEK